MNYLECPTCAVLYPWKRLYSGHPQLGRRHSVACSNCGTIFEFFPTVRRRWQRMWRKAFGVGRLQITQPPPDAWATKATSPGVPDAPDSP